MKLLHLTFRFEFAEAIGRILDRHDIEDFVRYPMIEGRDCDGKHFGTQVFPGNMTAIHAHVPDERLSGLMEELRKFRKARIAHEHLRAVVLDVAEHI